MDAVPYNRERRSVFACTTLVARVTVFCPQKLFSNKRKKIILKLQFSTEEVSTSVSTGKTMVREKKKVGFD